MKPIIFNSEMVKAILDGGKTQTRRPVKPQPPEKFDWYNLNKFPCQPGDILYVRETFCIGAICEEDVYGQPGNLYVGQCGSDDTFIPQEYTIRNGICTEEVTWKPSIHMPKKHARLFIKVTDVQIERVQTISHFDCVCEGIKPMNSEQAALIKEKLCADDEIIEKFADLWDSIYKKRGLGWDDNPFVWKITFEQTERCSLTPSVER